MIWEGRFSLGRLQRAWMSIRDKIADRPTWNSCRGPISAVLLSLRRVGWSMSAAHVITSDEGLALGILRCSPRDLKLELQVGIQRWQARGILKHLPQASGDERVWMRDLRHGVLKSETLPGKVPSDV